ncbi:methyltransferase domain-containing protein [Crocosphaera watsonii WH 8501]|uniref:Similar to Methylase involved in ubiquinone/menaquinone biosynthesis n=1 Tax=Crocosphaera watsonii WH 8501 TaxID=165597 RepID=Q4C4F1_CROWT|nr:methyltransferase domain-containing protein [Crocosphaera watsonii]EAM51052.1 similar to Methylase involved in ubiquinone/menaquinone biosynthesis [Crocosphaera watsonii WH 8501]
MAIIKVANSSKKDAIANNFSKGVANYLSHSQVQKESAEKLLEIAKNSVISLPKGTILEIGCGTGFVTKGLIKQFPDHFFDIIDISEEMLNYCANNLQISEAEKELIQFRKIDGERVKAEPHTYAAIISSFTVQWFEDIVNSLNRLINMLQPGGILLLAFPNHRSFPEWKKMCQELNLPFTRNQLPNTEEVIRKLSIPPHKIHLLEGDYTMNYENAADFFRSLKIIGAGLNLKQEKLSIPEMKRLINYWNSQCYPDQVEVSYDVTFLLIKLI